MESKEFKKIRFPSLPKWYEFTQHENCLQAKLQRIYAKRKIIGILCQSPIYSCHTSKLTLLYSFLILLLSDAMPETYK